MKNSLLILTFLSLFLIGCKSKKEKAADLIRTELSKTLYVFDSYEPIETTVSEAKLSVYTDTACWAKANALLHIVSESQKSLNAAKIAKERMEMWDMPSTHSSSYYYNKYNKYYNDYKEKLEEATKYYEILKFCSAELRDEINGLDPNKVIGWEVKHRFRCKTRGGDPTIGDLRYVIDKNFKNILIVEDIDGDDYNLVREVIEASINGTFEEI